MKQRDERCRDITTKWIRLVSPVKAMRSSGVVSERMLGLVVVSEHLSQLIL